VAVQAVAGDGNTQVPPVPSPADPLIDCNNDVGRVFNFATYQSRSGSIAVFNSGAAAITFSLTNLSTGNPQSGFQNIAVSPGNVYFGTGLGTQQYQLSASGEVSVWAGDQEPPTAGDPLEIQWMGDDYTNNFGRRGQQFVIQSQSLGAVVFASETNTQVTVTPQGGAPSVTTLGADGFLPLPAIDTVYTIDSSKPVSVQTAGGNALNDYVLQLRPSVSFDTDSNTVSDWDEGGACESVAPDTDGDGVYDYADTDDDNDCWPDVNELSTRLDPNLPASSNCSGATPVCDRTVGVCRGCLTNADCPSPLACNPQSLVCQSPPSTVVLSGPPAVTNAVTATFQFNSPGNPTATFECQLDNGMPFVCTSPYTTPALVSGPHVFRVRAAVGALVDPVGATVNWIIDTVSPNAPSILTPANGSRSNNATPIVTGTAEPNSTVTVSIDGVVVGNVPAGVGGAFSFALTTSLNDGTHVVTATSRDAAQNVSPASNPNVFVVDTTPPAAPIIVVPANGATVGSPNPTIAGTAEPLATVTIRVDGLVVGSVVADASGNFSLSTTLNLMAGSHSASAQATDVVGNTGPMSALTIFTVDLAVLDTGFLSTPPALSSSSTATFVFTSNKSGVSYECSLDAMAFSACSNPAVFNALSEGAHTLRVRAVRGAEVDSTPASYTWTVDTSAPAAPVINQPANGSTTANASVTVVGMASPQTTVTVFVDGANVGTVPTNGLGVFTLSLTNTLSNGSHTVRAIATDAAGNVSPSSMVNTFVVDTLAPLPPAIVVPVAQSTVSTRTPVISGTAEANAMVQVEIDGQPVGNATVNGAGQWTLSTVSPLTDGVHTARARAIDAVGNISAYSVVVAFTVDATAPSTPVIVRPANGAFLNDNTPLYVGTADPNVTVAIVVDNVTIASVVAASNGSFSFDSANPLTDGPHSVIVRATDAAGNVSSASLPNVFTVDTVAPATPVIVDPTANQTVGLPSTTIRGIAEAGSLVTIIIDSVVAGTSTADSAGNFSFTTAPLTEGQHSVSATARDAAGNVSPTSVPVSFTVDTALLDTSILTGPRSPSNLSSATFSFGSNKSPVTFECKLDNASFVACSNPATFSSLADGPHQLQVRAIFGAVIDSTPSVANWIVDTVAPPAPVIVNPANGSSTAVNTVTVTGTAEPGSTVTVILDSGIAGTTTANAAGEFTLLLPTTLSQGLHTVSAIATDAAGNQSPSSAVNTFQVDTQVPAAPVILVPISNSVFNTGTPTISGTAEAGTTIRVTANGVVVASVNVNALGQWSVLPAMALADGQYTLVATSADASGNVSPASNAVVIIVDATAPLAPIILVPVNGSSVNTPLPVIRGTSEPLSIVTVSIDGANVGTVAADASGMFAVPLSTPLVDGPHVATAQAVDAAQNASLISAAVSFTVDTQAPLAPVIVTPGEGEAVESAAVQFSGTAEPLCQVELKVDGVVQGVVQADGVGNWTRATASLGEGAHVLEASCTDAAGNLSSIAERRFTVTVFDGGMGADAGEDGGVDGGEIPADGGVVDSGMPRDAGGVDAGVKPEEPPVDTSGYRFEGSGCGCNESGTSPILLLGAVLLLWSRTRRRV
jgi:large repetitive protein